MIGIGYSTESSPPKDLVEWAKRELSSAKSGIKHCRRGIQVEKDNLKTLTRMLDIAENGDGDSPLLTAWCMSENEVNCVGWNLKSRIDNAVNSRKSHERSLKILQAKKKMLIKGLS